MEIFKPGINVDFVGKRYIAFTLSGISILATILLLIWRGGPNYGVDFAGGVVVQVKFNKSHTASEIREALKPIDLGDSIIQEFGEKGQFEYLIRVARKDVQLSGLDERVRKALIAQVGEGVEIRRVEMVGPQVGEDLTRKALYSILGALLMMGVYVTGRFQHMWIKSIFVTGPIVVAVLVIATFKLSVTSVVWLIVLALLATMVLYWFMELKYAMGGVVSLIHDVTVVIGAFALTNREIDLTIVAALLTIVGYSINDNIVVYDRIRENLSKYRRKPFLHIINVSVNETLSRTILTGTTTLVILIVLLFLGGPVIHDFAFALLVGIITGTYSSIYVASPVLLLWETKSSAKNSSAKGLKTRE
ncbi:MAG: protein translocase subunit SecF [Thermodesulfobacteriota bacterium]